ncbi:MAG: hypothetical protein ABL900_16570 [Burkholderiaceae bacterium]
MPAGFANEVAACAARLIVEEGMEYGPAKRRAARDLGRHKSRSADLPDNQAIEDEVRTYLALFCGDTQPAELAALRKIAKEWMQRLVGFRPHLAGAVWRGTATRNNDVHLQLFCDDPKSAEITLLNMGVDFAVGTTTGLQGQSIDVLSITAPSQEFGMPVTVHLAVHDHDELRGALRPDDSGRARRGDLNALSRLEAQQP